VLPAALAGTMAAAPATAAAARPVTAVMTIVGRNDSGGGGIWAMDNFTRTLTLYYLGKSTRAAATR
jgi:hypothetical protein